jgi:hypothetical protein
MDAAASEGNAPTSRREPKEKGPERLGLPLGANLPIPGSLEESVPRKRNVCESNSAELGPY